MDIEDKGTVMKESHEKTIILMTDMTELEEEEVDSKKVVPVEEIGEMRFWYTRKKEILILNTFLKKDRRNQSMNKKLKKL